MPQWQRPSRRNGNTPHGLNSISETYRDWCSRFATRFSTKKSKACRKHVANPHELVENLAANLVETRKPGLQLARIMECDLNFVARGLTIQHKCILSRSSVYFLVFFFYKFRSFRAGYPSAFYCTLNTHYRIGDDTKRHHLPKPKLIRKTIYVLRNATELFCRPL